MANAQDAEQKEKLERLSADMEALLATNIKLQTEIGKLKEELSRVREEASRPNTDPSIPGIREDLRKLAEKIQEVDRKRIDDTRNVAAEFEKLEKLIRNAASAAAKESSKPPRSTPTTSNSSHSGKPEKVFEYTVRPGDSLSKILSLVNAQFK
jgi:predicted nuclease with TOPRIM domain